MVALLSALVGRAVVEGRSTRRGVKVLGMGAALDGRRYRPNPAFSGRGWAAREPGRFSGKVASPAGLLDGHAAPLTLVLGG